MSDRPTITPVHATTGTKTEPPSGFKTTGAVPGVSWPAQYVNYTLYHIIQWLTWFSNKILQRSSISDSTPILATSDRAGNIRAWLCPNGYSNGPEISERYTWGPANISETTARTLVSSGSPQLLVDGHATCTMSIEYSTRSNSPVLKLTPATSATTGAGVGTIIASGEDPPISNLPDVVAVWESSFEIDNVNEDCDYYFGLHDLDQASGGIDPSNLPNSTSYSACFSILGLFGADDALYAQTTDGSSVNLQDTLINITNNQRYHLRIEVHGANTPVGVAEGVGTARFFVDGVLVHEEVGSTCPRNGTGKLGSCIAVARSISSGSATFSAGATRLSYNDTLAAVVPA